MRKSDKGIKNFFVKFTVISLLLVISNFAQTLSVTPINGGKYNVGENSIWTIKINNGDTTITGQSDYILKSGGLIVIETGTINIVNGIGYFKYTSNEPGSLVLEVTYNNVKKLGGAIFNFYDILPSSNEPDDFDQFWQSKIAELDSIPIDAIFEKVDIQNGIDYWKVTMNNINGSKIYGQIAKPSNSTEKLPAVLQLQWAGVYGLDPSWVTWSAQNGWLAMNIIAHDIPIDESTEYYENLDSGELNGYAYIGNEDRDSSYFLRMYLSCYRAVEYLTTRDDWNGSILHVKGASQGGLQSVMVAGLHQSVTAVTANVPAGCDQTGELVGRDPGWPKWFLWGGSDNKEAKIEASKYYDVVNFAKRVTCPSLIGAGLIDDICPPEGVAAMFNQLGGEKRLVLHSVGGHQSESGSHYAFTQIEEEWIDSLKVNKSVPTKEKTINLIAPNGGELLETGSVFEINWETELDLELIVEYTTDDTSDYPEWRKVLETPFPWEKIYGPAQKYEWEIPEIESDYCKIKISNSQMPWVYDVSESVFSINNLTNLDLTQNLDLSHEFNLYQNYPNPFNPTTKIKYSIPSHNHVKLSVYDSLGKEVTELVNQNQSAGTYEIKFDATELSSGLYFSRIVSGNNSKTEKMMLIK